MTSDRSFENATPEPEFVADAPSGNWVDERAPDQFKPYLRLARADRPIGSWLLLIPGWQGLALAGLAADWRADRLESFGWLTMIWLFAAFLIGGFVMRGAGCVLNDIVDRDIDAKVERTRSRPLASGAVSLTEAIGLLAILCLIGLAILTTFRWPAVFVGLAAAIPVIIYPFMKRITWWPQLFLGIAFNWGILLAWAQMQGTIALAPALLYLSAICWTIGYDTIYAHQDREDDALIGVKSTALLFGEDTKKALMIFYGLAVFLAGLAGFVAGGSLWFWVGLLFYAAHLGMQIKRLDIDDPDLCLILFRSNREAALLLFAALLFGGL